MRPRQPFLHALGIGSYHWGPIQGLSQTWEPHGACFEAARRGERKDLRLWRRDLYRFNGFPYDPFAESVPATRGSRR